MRMGGCSAGVSTTYVLYIVPMNLQVLILQSPQEFPDARAALVRTRFDGMQANTHIVIGYDPHDIENQKTPNETL